MRAQKLKPIQTQKAHQQESENVPKDLETKLKELKLKMKQEKEQREGGMRWRDNTMKQLTTNLPKLIDHEGGMRWRELTTNLPKPIDPARYLVLPNFFEFLQRCNLVQYLTVFQQQGIISLEKLQALNNQDLKTLGVLPGHIIKILKSTKLYSEKTNKNVNVDQQTEEICLKKESCFTCYRLMSKIHTKIYQYEHYFCSSQCFNIFKIENIMTCKGCGIGFLIINGLKISGQGFCSEVCKPKIMDLIPKWEKEIDNIFIEDYNLNENQFINNENLIQNIEIKYQQINQKLEKNLEN